MQPDNPISYTPQSVSPEDALRSAVLTTTMDGILKRRPYRRPFRVFLKSLESSPWIVECLVYTVIARWSKRVGTAEGVIDTSMIVRDFLETGGFFPDEIKETTRIEFALYVVDVASEYLSKPLPEGGRWN